MHRNPEWSTWRQPHPKLTPNTDILYYTDNFNSLHVRETSVSMMEPLKWVRNRILTPAGDTSLWPTCAGYTPWWLYLLGKHQETPYGTPEELKQTFWSSFDEKLYIQQMETKERRCFQIVYCEFISPNCNLREYTS